MPGVVKMDKDSNDFEKKLKLASNYFVYSVLLVAAILFLLYSVLEIFQQFFGFMSPFITLILGIYLLFGALFWVRLKIKRGN